MSSFSDNNKPLYISFNIEFLHTTKHLSYSNIILVRCEFKQLKYLKMLYPNIDPYRDMDDVSNFYEPSCLEKNCSQIFMKGPVMTKEIFDKVNKSDIVTRKTSICGKKLKTRRIICKYPT